DRDPRLRLLREHLIKELTDIVSAESHRDGAGSGPAWAFPTGLSEAANPLAVEMPEQKAVRETLRAGRSSSLRPRHLAGKYGVFRRIRRCRSSLGGGATRGLGCADLSELSKRRQPRGGARGLG